MKNMKKALAYLLLACMLVPNVPMQEVSAAEKAESAVSTNVAESADTSADVAEQENVTVETEATTLNTSEEVTVTKIECKPVTVIENTNGYSNYCMSGSWWCYNVYPYYTVELSDGAVYEDLNWGGFFHENQYYQVQMTTNQTYETQWGLGEHTATLTVGNVSEEYTITIVENPIASVVVGDVTIVEGTHGSITGYYDGQQNYVEYYHYSLQEVAPDVEITLKDGTKIPDDSFSYMGRYYDSVLVDYQSYENQWGVGTHTAAIQTLGTNYEYDVTITESPYTDIEIVNMALVVENKGGEYDGENYIYHIPDFTYRLKGEGTESIVQYYSEDWDRQVYSKYGIEITVESDQEENPWEPGKDNYFTIKYLDIEKTVKVEVKAASTYDYYVDEGQVFITGCRDFSENLVIPSTIDNLPVAGILDLGSVYQTAVSITIPDSVTVIAESAFSDFYYTLESVSIGSGVTYLSLDMFAQCFALKSIKVSDNNANYSSVDGVLYDKAGKTLIAYPLAKGDAYEIPATATDVEVMFDPVYDNVNMTVAEGSTAFVEEDGIIYNHDKTKVISCDTSKEGAYVMPNTVTEIGDYAFMYSNLSSVTVSSGVTDIAYMSFYNCGSLTKVELPSTIKSIETYAFSSCYELETINMPNTLESIGDGAFSGTAITEIVIPDSVTSIGVCVFCNCNSLVNATIGTNVSYIPASAFESCDKLTTVELKNTSVQVGAYAFSSCTSLKDFDFDNITGNVGECAFASTGLESVALPTGVTKLVYGFTGSDELSTILLPESLIHIDAGSFESTKWHNNQEDSVVYLGHVLLESHDSESTKLSVKDGTTVIADCALGGRDNYTEVQLPEGLRAIGDSAFIYCEGLTEITIPASVEYIGTNAFRACTNLTSINVDANNKEYMSIDGVLFSKDGTRLIWCPKQTADSYTVPNSVQYISSYAFSDSNLKKIIINNPSTILGENAIRLDSDYCWMDVTLACPENSVAHEYAKNNLITYETIEVTSGWIQDENGWKYVDENGNGVQNGWASIDGYWYYFVNGYRAAGWVHDGSAYYYMNPETGIMVTNQWVADNDYYLQADGTMATGWVLIDNNYYYFYSNGLKATGQWIGDYYVKSDGIMAVSEWVGNYYVNASGAYVSTTGWFYLNGQYYYLIGGAKVANQWVGAYYMDVNGVMATNQWVGAYYVDGSGAYVSTTGWFYLNGQYYYLVGGAKVTNQWVGNYYLKSDGVMATNEWVDNGKYYVDISGAYVVVTGWFSLQGEYYYLVGGAKQIGWLLSGATWYYLDTVTGVMYADEWLNDTYYFYGNGAMATGWAQMQNGDYYYFDASGAKVVNAWIGDYYLGEDGVMATSQWIDGKYWVDENGKWDPNKEYVEEEPGDSGETTDPEEPGDSGETTDPETPTKPAEPGWGGFF